MAGVPTTQTYLGVSRERTNLPVSFCVNVIKPKSYPFAIKAIKRTQAVKIEILLGTYTNQLKSMFHLPKQANPSPVNPALHLQDLRPGRVIFLTHVAF